MAQIRDLQNEVNSLSDTREFYDRESGSTSGATHVPDQNSMILSSTTLLRCDPGLPRSTQKCTGIMGNVFERPLAQEGESSTLFNNSKNLASSSQDMRAEISETARNDMKRESMVTPIQPPHFQSRSRMLDHTGGTYSLVGIMNYPRVLITEWNLGNFQTLWNFEAGSLTSGLKFVCEQPNLKSRCCGSKKLK